MDVLVVATIRLWVRRALLIFVGSFCWSALAVIAQTFEPTFFGVHVHRSVPNKLWKDVGFGAIRLHDSNVTWSELEPSKGGWKWERLDKIVQNAKAAGVDILLPLQATPRWAASNPNSEGAYGLGANSAPEKLDDWASYVGAVVARYKGSVTAYEVWNEPNLKQFFNGTPAEMAALTKRAFEVIRSIDPAAKVVCSGITGDYGISWLKAYLAAGAGKYCDVIGYHFYTHHKHPEAMLPIVAAVRNEMRLAGVDDKPLWNTESGWLIAIDGPVDNEAAGFPRNAKVLSSDEAVAYIPRALLLARYAGVSRFYWYSWDHPSMGFSTGRGTGWSRPGRVYASFLRIASNSKLESCSRSGVLWVCTLQRAGGGALWVAWTEAGEKQVPSPLNGALLKIQSTGDIQLLKSVNVGELVHVGIEPIFIRGLNG